MENDFLNILIPALGTLLGVIAVQIFTFLRQKLYLNKKFDHQDKQTSDLDKKQTERIDLLEEKINISDNSNLIEVLTEIKKDISTLKGDIQDLNTLHKYTSYIKDIKRDVENTVSDIIAIKKIGNEEMQRTLAYGVKKAIILIEEIIRKDFVFDVDKLKEEIIISFKAVKISITEKNLNLKNSQVFLKELKNTILLKHTDKFLTRFLSVSKLSNGERRKEFKNISLELVENIVIETIDLYNMERKNG